MKILSTEFMKKIAMSLQDEEIDIYTMTLYMISSEDIGYFNEVDRDRVKEIFKILINDTKQHTELLKLIVELGSR